MSDLLPIIILAGGNDRVETIPDGFTADDLLRGFKGAVKLPSGAVHRRRAGGADTRERAVREAHSRGTAADLP